MLKALRNAMLMFSSKATINGKTTLKPVTQGNSLSPFYSRGEIPLLGMLMKQWLVGNWEASSSFDDEWPAVEGAEACFPMPHWVQGHTFPASFSICVCGENQHTDDTNSGIIWYIAAYNFSGLLQVSWVWEGEKTWLQRNLVCLVSYNKTMHQVWNSI